MLLWNCIQSQKKLKTDDIRAGKRLKCPGCGVVQKCPPGKDEQTRDDLTGLVQQLGRNSPGSSARKASEQLGHLENANAAVFALVGVLDDHPDQLVRAEALGSLKKILPTEDWQLLWGILKEEMLQEMRRRWSGNTVDFMGFETLGQEATQLVFEKLTEAMATQRGEHAVLLVHGRWSIKNSKSGSFVGFFSPNDRIAAAGAQLSRLPKDSARLVNELAGIPFVFKTAVLLNLGSRNLASTSPTFAGQTAKTPLGQPHPTIGPAMSMR